MGETRADRVGFIHALATLPRHPESVPVNALVPVKGTVLGDMLADTPLAKIDDIEFVRTVAAARITMPRSCNTGSTSAVSTRYCSATSSPVVWRILSSCRAGDIWSAPDKIGMRA